ncbi:MAG TPA: histidine phosphatase family protein [Alphaproteobacteria bacterium]|nr:histidine phosphatase family protein [Alphaproteobacteria bacterium]
MFLLRHGQSAFNQHFAQSGRDPGIIDAPLTPRGLEQAEGAAKHFLNLKTRPQRQAPPSRILCSPYTRALQTATPIARALGLPLKVSPFLGERRLYSCDIGTKLARLKAAWPGVDFSPVEKDDWWPPREESQEDIERRVQAFLALEDGAEETLIVSHWYFIFTLSGIDCENCDIVWRDGQGKFHRQ